MTSLPLYLAAIAVDALDTDVVSTQSPLTESEDFLIGGVLDSRGRHWVVKVARNPVATTILEAEAALAPSLLAQLRAGKLPFDIMRPAGYSDVDGAGRAVVFAEPFGRTRDFEEYSESDGRALGRAIAAIHSLPSSTVEDAGLPVDTAAEWRERNSAEVARAVRTGDVPSLLRRRWERLLDDDELWSYTPVVVHGDVAGDNFLWSNGKISTVLGFGEAQLGDPAQDLAPLVYIDTDVWDAVVAAYENTMKRDLTDGDFSRILFTSEISIARWLMHGVTTGNEAIRSDAIQMLRELADQVRDDEDAFGTAPVIPVSDGESAVSGRTSGDARVQSRIDSDGADSDSGGDAARAGAGLDAGGHPPLGDGEREIASERTLRAVGDAGDTDPWDDDSREADSADDDGVII